MAICLSHVFSQMVGSVAGVTYFYNRYASIIARNRTVPTDPNTPAQQTVRTRMSAAVSAWQSLTNLQREVWKGFADNTPWVNSLGQDCRLSSLNMYLSIRLAALQILPGLPSSSFDAPPCTPGLFPHCKHSISTCTSGVMQLGFAVNITNTNSTGSIRVGIHMSTAQNTSINFWKGPYDAAAYSITPPIPPGFGIGIDFIRLTLGKRYFLKFRVLDVTNNNNVSSEWYDHAEAAYCTS